MTLILSLSFLVVLAAGSARADVTVRRSARTRGRVDIVVTRAPMAEVAGALETFLLFNRVPCAVALDTILTTMGLGRYSESGVVTAVGRRPGYPG